EKLVGAVERLVTSGPQADGATSGHAVVELVPVAGAEADAPQLAWERALAGGQEGVGVEQLIAQRDRAGPLVPRVLPEREVDREVLPDYAQLSAPPRHRLVGEPGDPVVDTEGHRAERRARQQPQAVWETYRVRTRSVPKSSPGRFGRRDGRYYGPFGRGRLRLCLVLRCRGGKQQRRQPREQHDPPQAHDV